MNFFFIRGLLVFVFLLHASFSLAKPISQDTRGTPETANKNLPLESFVGFWGQKLKYAKVVWVDKDYFRSQGYDVPRIGLTQEFNEMLTDELGYGVLNEFDNPEMFLPKKKLFYASRYGGEGTGDAEGDGRAAAAGKFQIKGIKSPLAPQPISERTHKNITLWKKIKKIFSRLSYKVIFGKISDYHHSNGAATLREGMAEAFWSKILDRELPFGANRTVAIIATGLVDRYTREPLALIVRELSTRPAHFMTNWHARETDETKEYKRVNALTDWLLDSLEPNHNLSRGERLHKGILDTVTRIGQKYATEYAISFYQGSDSPSNIGIKGKAVDHTSLTALDGFPQAMFADDSPSGDLNELKVEIIYDFIDDLKKTLPEELVPSIPTRQEIADLLRHVYDRQVFKGFLWRAGCPPEMLESVVDLPEAREFALELRKLARKGNDELVNTRFWVPRNTGKYNFNKIINILISSNIENPTNAKALLRKEMKDGDDVADLERTFNHYWEVLKNESLKQGLKPEHLGRYMVLSSPVRNRNLPELMRGPVMWLRQYAQIIYTKMGRDITNIGRFIDDTVTRNTRSFPNAAPYSVVLEEFEFQDTSNTVQRIFDAKTGEFAVLVTAIEANGKTNFFGNEILGSLANGKSNLMVDGRSYVGSVTKDKDSNVVSVRFSDFDIHRLKKNMDLKIYKSSIEGVTGNGCARILAI